MSVAVGDQKKFGKDSHDKLLSLMRMCVGGRRTVF